MKWQILIATTVCRREQFNELFAELNRQITELDLHNEIEILFDEDEKQKSIGKKRQDLLELSTAEYICYFDSDDFPFLNYVSDIYNAILTGCDCVGMIISMTTNGINPQTCCHSLRFPVWENNKAGYDYVRNVTHFNPVKRSLAIQIGFSDKRFGEDHEYSDKVTKLCKTEIFIDIPLFHYRYSNNINHKIKYGITNE